jgi:CheY-like chemotaxis protein
MKRVLVIEDNADMRAEIVDMLGFEGFDVLQAEDGRAGLEVVAASRPDLILCDVMMPNLDGYGTLAALRRDPATARMPFVFLTAKASDEDVQRARTLGADGYVTKPFRVEDLVTALQAALDKG